MPTALELIPEGWKPYLEAARSRPAPPGPTPTEERQREQVLARVGHAAEALKAQFGVKRVVLFGSLVQTTWLKR
ncbi:MAG: hypothetical protein QHH07_09560 [Sedimentisphaerales bacterium]|jgi:hypothetical protein|nr:hypothetical protein [Sedimentisphaerales bacterium]